MKEGESGKESSSERDEQNRTVKREQRELGATQTGLMASGVRCHVYQGFPASALATGGARAFSGVGSLLCTAGCLLASLASSHSMPVAPLPLSKLGTKHVCRRSQVASGGRVPPPLPGESPCIEGSRFRRESGGKPPTAHAETGRWPQCIAQRIFLSQTAFSRPFFFFFHYLFLKETF